MQLRSNLNFNRNQAINLILENAHTDTASLIQQIPGAIYFNRGHAQGHAATSGGWIEYCDLSQRQIVASRQWVHDQIGMAGGYTGWHINSLNQAAGSFQVINQQNIAFVAGTDITVNMTGPTGWAHRILTFSHNTYPAPTQTNNAATTAISSMTFSNGHVTGFNLITRVVTHSLTSTTVNNIPYYNTTGGILHNVGYNLVTSATGITGTGSDTAVPSERSVVNFVRDHIHGLSGKEAVKATALTNINIANPGTNLFDNVVLAVGERILLRVQTAAAENGIYIFNGSTSAMTRSLDGNTWNELVSAFVFVEAGSTFGDTGWFCTINTGGTLGTTAITWVRFFSIADISATNTGTGVHAYVTDSTRPFIFRSFLAHNTIGAGLSVSLSGGANNEIVYRLDPGSILLSHLGGVLNAGAGGTGLTSYARGDMLFADPAVPAATTLAKLAIGSNGHVMVVVGGIPAWRAVDTIGVVTTGQSNLFNVTVSANVLTMNSFGVRTENRFYHHADNPNTAGLGLKFGGTLSVFGMFVHQNISVTGTAAIGGATTLSGVLNAGTLPVISLDPLSISLLGVNLTGPGPWEVRRITLQNIMAQGHAATHYTQDISGFNGVVLRTEHNSGSDPIVLLRESATGGNFLDVYGSIAINTQGDVTWSVASEMPVGSKIIIIGSENPR